MVKDVSGKSHLLLEVLKPPQMLVICEWLVECEVCGVEFSPSELMSEREYKIVILTLADFACVNW